MFDLTAIRPRLALLFLIGLLLVGCQANTLPPNPTVIPSAVPASETPRATPSATLAVSSTPAPTFRPIISPTSGPTIAAALPNLPTTTPSPALNCFTAKSGDTVYSLLSRGGYADPSAAPAFRELNNMPPGSSVIQVGQKYCIPLPTATPTREGWELTQTVIAPIIPTQGAMNLQEYIVKDGDTAGSVEAKTSTALSLLCRLNPLPDGLNCAGCDMNAPIYQAKCRPTVRIGQKIKYPGPTPTPSVTPTLTGSETATPLPAYSAPRILYPLDGATVSGPVRLAWLPGGGMLHPDEQYMILMTDATVSGSPRNLQFFTQATSFLLAAELGPQDGNPRTIYWQVGIARIGGDGSAILVSEKSRAVSFTWQQP